MYVCRRRWGGRFRISGSFEGSGEMDWGIGLGEDRDILVIKLVLVEYLLCVGLYVRYCGYVVSRAGVVFRGRR